MTNPTTKKSQRVRFEEVTPTNEIVVYFNTQLPSLLADTGLPIFSGYDDLDDIQFAYITLPSGNTVVLGQYGNAPEIGVDLYVDFNPKNNLSTIAADIPALVVETLRYLAIPRETAVWFHPDYEQEIDRLYSEHRDIKPTDRLELASLPSSEEREPIDCFYYALEIYTREKLPEYWAMLQHNLGLAYFDRIKGERRENLKKSIECFNKSLEVFTQEKFPEKWQINQEDLRQSRKELSMEKQNLVEDTKKEIILSATEENILSVIRGYSQGVYGLDILNQINKANKENNRREIPMSSLYPVFKRMEQQGLVTARWGEEALGEESGGARRRYYAISADGKIALNATQSYRQQLSSDSILAI